MAIRKEDTHDITDSKFWMHHKSPIINNYWANTFELTSLNYKIDLKSSFFKSNLIIALLKLTWMASRHAWCVCTFYYHFLLAHPFKLIMMFPSKKNLNLNLHLLPWKIKIMGGHGKSFCLLWYLRVFLWLNGTVNPGIVLVKKFKWPHHHHPLQ